MQSTLKSLLFYLLRVFDRSYLAVHNWVRREIVDNDPHDVDTLFPEEER